MDETRYTGRWGEKCLQNFGLETLREEARSRKYPSITSSFAYVCVCLFVCLFVCVNHAPTESGFPKILRCNQPIREGQ
jgi:hypothetical protein